GSSTSAERDVTGLAWVGPPAKLPDTPPRRPEEIPRKTRSRSRASGHSLPPGRPRRLRARVAARLIFAPPHLRRSLPEGHEWGTPSTAPATRPHRNSCNGAG